MSTMARKPLNEEELAELRSNPNIACVLNDRIIFTPEFKSEAYDQLIAGIEEKLMPLDGDTEVLPGHGPASSIGYERVTNPFLHP